MVSSLSVPPSLVKPFANEGDKNTIPTDATGTQAASLEEGFPEITATPINEGGIPPKREDFNGLGFLTTSQYFYLQNGGRFTFNPEVSSAINGYPEGAVLQYTDPNTGQSFEVTSLLPNNTYNFVTNPEYIDGLKWRKSFSEDLTNYVTTNTQQDITGLKNFSNDGTDSENAQIELTLTNIDLSTNPVSSQYGGILLKDVNGERLGKLEAVQTVSGSIRVQLCATNSNGDNSLISAQVTSNGTKSATISTTPPQGSNTTQIATTGWVNGAFGVAFKNNNSLSTTAQSYTAPSSGVMYITGEERYGRVRTFTINGTQMLAEYDRGHSSTTNGYWTTTLLLSRGDVLEMNFTPKAGRFVPFKVN